MSLPRSLLLLVVVVCTAHLCAAQWPCPDPDAISPCKCTYNADYDVFMDCSDIDNDIDLASVFATAFPFNDLRRLTIHPSDPHPYLTTLPHSVFGDKSFQEIEITNTYITTVEEETLVNSHGTLLFLHLQSNEISTFPIETLELFTLLDEFDISYNKLSGPLPDVVSDSLLYLNLSGNTGLTLSYSTFVGAPNLEELRLSDMGLGNAMTADVFLSLKFLKTLHLNNNGISGTLIQGFISNELKPLTTVQLIGNAITSIHPEAVTGINPLGTISFMGNQIQYLLQEEWGDLVALVTQDNAIDVTSNPLVCGCDIMWLVFDSVLMAKFDENTTCVGGVLMTDLPQTWFTEHCSGAPMQPSPQPSHLSSR